MARDVFILRDSQSPGNAIVVSSAASAVRVPFRQLVVDDIGAWNIYLVDGSGDYDALSGNAGYTVRMAVGTPGAVATGGSCVLTIGASTSPAIPHNVTAAELQTALNLLSSVIVSGGLTIAGGAGNFEITWTATGTMSDVVGDAASLTPASIVKVETTASGAGGTNKRQLISFAQKTLSDCSASTPIAYGWTVQTSLFTLQARAAIPAGAASGTFHVSISIIDPDGRPETACLTDVVLLAPPLAGDPTSAFTPPAQAFTETDPVFGSWLASTTMFNNGETAYLWGSHSLAGYATLNWVAGNYYNKNGGQIFGNTGVGINCPANTKALLDMSSSLKASRPWPPMTQTTREGLTAGLTLGTGDAGLVVYQIDGEHGIWHWQGAAWIPPSAVYCEGHYYAKTTALVEGRVEETIADTYFV
jgi:hypothetical protein